MTKEQRNDLESIEKMEMLIGKLLAIHDGMSQYAQEINDHDEQQWINSIAGFTQSLECAKVILTDRARHRALPMLMVSFGKR